MPGETFTGWTLVFPSNQILSGVPPKGVSCNLFQSSPTSPPNDAYHCIKSFASGGTVPGGTLAFSPVPSGPPLLYMFTGSSIPSDVCLGQWPPK
jgi:hypothetical protein